MIISDENGCNFAKKIINPLKIKKIFFILGIMEMI